MANDNVTIQRSDKTTFEADASFVNTPEFAKLQRTHGLKVVEQQPEAEPEKESKSKPSDKDKDAK
ncbi:hypothetical protein BWI93_05410 [Siphonobacter sp. BAB-5385]|uniref:hypothetical protein n=1 Tax=Siphonobacter sp. BAB-5385 TaxID=1864822 RepID=UPI000B9ED33C|nr:hypothetical protein [Siphonobacter sp. BAB-5385]OZI09185.1 hypothetical protein BWI93_05410 [Siphonobacter sp. BAB-5385]